MVTWALPSDLSTVRKNIAETASFMQKMTPNIKVGSVAGEWTAMTLARSGEAIPQEFFDRYYREVEKYVRQKKGILHTRKYTEYSRVILALTAIGKDPYNVAGYDLIKPLGDYENVIYQGINGPIFALIALDSGAYDMPICADAKVQATRQMYIDTIINRQIPRDDGFSLEGIKGDPDITGMALQALAPYKDDPAVADAIERALGYLSKAQNPDGGYESWGAPNSESVDQVIMALTALGIDPNDSRFVKNGSTLMDNLLTFYGEGGGFMHVKPGDQNNGGALPGVIDGMATDQGMYALIAYNRFYTGQNRFYDMTDVKKSTQSSQQDHINQDTIIGQATISKVIYPNKTFSDIATSDHATAIVEMAKRGILNGVSDTTFEPNRPMTRAEFCTMIVRAFHLKANAGKMPFDDVAQSEWYYPYVKMAYQYNIVNGKSDSEFQPNGKINRQEAAQMLYNSATILAMDKAVNNAEKNTYLPGYTDFATIPSWSKTALTFAIKHEMIDINQPALNPTQTVTRAELAHMMYQLLISAGL